MAFQIIRDDITLVSADAIVNTANPEPIYSTGTDTAIYTAAGAEELLAERKKIGDIAPGDARHTPAFALDAKYIIHTVGPAWQGGDAGERETVRRCYENSLALAKRLGCESIAFPLIATGNYGFPKDEALQIAISVFSTFLLRSEMDITLVVFDRESFVLSGGIFSELDAYIDEHYVDERIDEEYAVDRMRSQVVLSKSEKSGKSSFFSDLMRKSRSKNAATERRRIEPEPEEDLEEYACEEAAPDLEDIDLDICEEPAVEDDLSMVGMSVAASMSAPSLRSLDDLESHVADTWQEMLFRMIDEKGYKPADVYKRANISRKLFSKINSNKDYQPKKDTALAFCIGLQLNIDETKDFLARAGYALSPSSKFDLVLQFYIEKENYDMFEINEVLFDHGLNLIGKFE